MPYRRKRSARTFKKRVYRRKVAAIARSVVSRQLEDKYWTQVLLGSTNVLSTAQPTAVGTNWTFASALTGLVEGSSAQNRNGSRIRIRRIEFLVLIQPNVNSNTVDGSRCRVIGYHNKQAGGALPTATTIFDVDRLDTLRNITQNRRITVTRDYIHQMVVFSNSGTKSDGTGAVAFSSGPPIEFKWTMYPKKVITYQNNAVDATALLTDDYGLGWVANEASCCQALIIAKMVFNDL